MHPAVGTRTIHPPGSDQDLQAKARELGLWNLFLPHDSRGGGLTNLRYAPLAEITGWVPQLAPEALNCNAPDTGNMEVLTDFGTPEQQERWLTLAQRRDPVCVCHDRTRRCVFRCAQHQHGNPARRRRVRDQRAQVVDNRRDGSELQDLHRHGQNERGRGCPPPAVHGLGPRDTPGLTVVRPLMVYGYDDADHGGHAEVRFDNVRVPVSNLIGEEGSGFAIAQARLGPGRIHPLHARDRNG